MTACLARFCLRQCFLSQGCQPKCSEFEVAAPMLEMKAPALIRALNTIFMHTPLSPYATHMRPFRALAAAAVVTGVQIHNWGSDFDDPEPNLEFVAPVNVYAVVNGKKTYLDLGRLPVGGQATGELGGVSLLCLCVMCI